MMAEGEELAASTGQDISTENRHIGDTPSPASGISETMSGTVEAGILEPIDTNHLPSDGPASTEKAPVGIASAATLDPVKQEPRVQRLGFTLDIQDGKLEEYIEHHSKSRPEVVEALRSVGIRNLSLWAWQNRLFYYAEYVGTIPFEEAMDEYALKPGVKEWEELMHGYQAKIPGTDPASDVWWQPCTEVYHQS